MPPNKQEQRILIKFMAKEGLTAKQIHDRLLQVQGEILSAAPQFRDGYSDSRTVMKPRTPQDPEDQDTANR